MKNFAFLAVPLILLIGLFAWLLVAFGVIGADTEMLDYNWSIGKGSETHGMTGVVTGTAVGSAQTNLITNNATSSMTK